MKLIRILQIIIIILASAYLYTVYASEAASKESALKPVDATKPEEVIQRIYAECNPTAESCRPGVRADKTKLATMHTHTDLMNFACMLKGFKQVFWEQEKQFINHLKQIVPGITNQNITALLNHAHIQVLHVKLPEDFFDMDTDSDMEEGSDYESESDASDTPDFIYYTPAGKTNAHLLYKFLITRLYIKNPQNNDYITGHLLGYSDDDIKAYYYYQSKQSSASADKKYLAEKAEAETWIKAHTPGIEKWVDEHLTAQR